MLFNDWLIVYELLWLVLSRGWFVFIIGMRLLLCLVTPAFSRASVCNRSAIHLNSHHRHARKYHADDVILFSRELLTPPKGTILQLEFGNNVQEALRGMLYSILSGVLVSIVAQVLRLSVKCLLPLDKPLVPIRIITDYYIILCT